MTGSDSTAVSTDPKLLGRLRNFDDHQSWQEFYKTYRKLIYRFARRQGLPDQEALDVVQDTLLAVARSLHEFKYDADRSSFKHWLWRLTRNRVVDHVRRRPREVPLRSRRTDDGTGGTGTAERIADAPSRRPDAQWQAEREAKVLEAALEKLKRQVKAKHYQVFDLLVLQLEPAARVARATGVSVAQVYLVKHRVMRAFNRMVEGVKSDQRS